DAGRRDFSRRQATPPAARARSALRTVRVEQPRRARISEGLSPAALAVRIRQRRGVKAEGERSPPRRAWGSSGDNGRTKRGGLIPPPPRRRSPCIGSVWNLH